MDGEDYIANARRLDSQLIFFSSLVLSYSLL